MYIDQKSRSYPIKAHMCNAWTRSHTPYSYLYTYQLILVKGYITYFQDISFTFIVGNTSAYENTLSLDTMNLYYFVSIHDM